MYATIQFIGVFILVRNVIWRKNKGKIYQRHHIFGNFDGKDLCRYLKTPRDVYRYCGIRFTKDISVYSTHVHYFRPHMVINHHDQKIILLLEEISTF